jgi:hypothetical protein
MINAYKEVKTEKQHLNRKYKTLSKGTYQNGTLGIEYPNDLSDDSNVYGNQNKKI